MKKEKKNRYREKFLFNLEEAILITVPYFSKNFKNRKNGKLKNY